MRCCDDHNSRVDPEAIALASHRTIVTRNRQGFGKVPNVPLTDWTIP
ncbi:MAG: hypothetical protein AB4042_14735 [Leptolyngbyaceae cyanobacterium]